MVGAALEYFPLESLKNLFLLPRTQPKLGKWAAPKVAFSQLTPLPISPISSNAIFIEINPRGKKIAINIPQTHGFGNTVAWGHHLRVPLRRQNHELSTPSREKPPTEHQKHHNDDKSSVVISGKDLTQQVRTPPARQGCPSLS